MEMPKVDRCEVTECSYNINNMCHALAITVGGDAAHPECDTYCNKKMKGGDKSAIGRVGACKVDTCQFNQSFECTAQSITVGHAQDAADCLTFRET